MTRRLEGQGAVVTGVASGLGREIARELASEGARVLGCDVNDVGGAATMSEIGHYRHADVSREREMEALIDEAVERFGQLDVMVNNAAIQIEAELAETTEEQLDRILGVNLKGVFFGCKYAVRAMRPAGGGAIVNIASVLGLVGDGILAAYCAAKGGVLGVTARRPCATPTMAYGATRFARATSTRLWSRRTSQRPRTRLHYVRRSSASTR